MNYYLGLDISTSITGFTLLNENGDTIICDHINLKKEEKLFNKAKKVEQVLKEKVFDKYENVEVFIEESLQMFSMGKSSAKTLSMLTKFNGIISWIVWDKFKCLPKHISAATARKKCGIRTEKGKRGKDVVMEYMLACESWFVVEYGRTGKVKNPHYDEADSFIIAKAGFLSCTKQKNQKF